MSWSYLYLGKAALMKINKRTKKHIFAPNQIDKGILNKDVNDKGVNHPPQKSIVLNELIISILAYSPKENIANPIAEYSTLYPDTNSASASGKSKGWRFVSAKAVTKNINHKGKNVKTCQRLAWDSIILERLKEPTKIAMITIMKPIETS